MESFKSSNAKEVLGFEKIDRKDPVIMEALADAPVFKKQGRVNAHRATVGERIVTTLKGGMKETENTAKEGDWIVTNPSGEQYIVSEKKFLDRYEPTDEDGTYSAKGYCRAIVNPFGRPIEIMARWGSPQTGGADCMVVDTCDKDGSNRGNEPYLIDASAFRETYAQVSI